MDQEKTDRVFLWHHRLREFVSARKPTLHFGKPFIKIINSQGKIATLKWAVPVENPLFIDVKCWPLILFLDADQRPIEVPYEWTWHPDEQTEHRYIHMDRDYCFYVQGLADTELSGIIKMPIHDAERIQEITAQVNRSEFDPTRFLPRWSPNLAVRTDRVERQGKLLGIHARENIVNDEYCRQDLTPVVRLLNSDRKIIQEVACERWIVPARTGMTYEKYVPLKKEIAAQLGQCYIHFTDPKCLFHEGDNLVSVEGRKSRYVKGEFGEQEYEAKAMIFNRGYEFARVTVEFRLFYNIRTPETPLCRQIFDVPPRSQLNIQHLFPMRQIRNGEFTLLRAELIQVVWGEMYVIPE